MGKDKIYTIRASRIDLIKRLHKLKEQTGRSISYMTETALLEYLDKEEKK